MNLLTDIAIEHTYKGKKALAPMSFTMHPFQNSVGPHRGRFEVFRDIDVGGSRKVRRSAHVTTQELAEMYARGLIEDYKIYLRLRPSNGVYPDAPPAKHVRRSCIEQGSSFDRMVRAVRISVPMSQALRKQLAIMGLEVVGP